MIALLVLAVAQAAPLADAHAYGSLGDVAPGLGVGLGIAAPVGPVHLEAAADVGGIGPVGFEAHGFGLLRWFPAGVAAPWSPSLRVGPGVRWAEGAFGPQALVGAALDLPSIGDARVRVGVDGLVRGGPTFTGRLSVGLVAGQGTRRVVEPPPSAAPFADPTGEAMVWVPHPVCRWVPAGEIEEWVGLVPPGQALVVRAPGYVPVEASASDLGAVRLEPAPEHGAAVVVAWPGDRVRVDSSEFVAPADGVVVLDLPVGLASIEVVGGGRAVALQAAVADGYSVWLRAEAPSPLRVKFPPAKATLDAAGLAAIGAIVANAGGASFTVEGSYSPEGVAGDNLRLAGQRAKVVADALIAAGLDPSRVTLAPSREPDTTLPPEAQRAVVVTPILPEIR